MPKLNQPPALRSLSSVFLVRFSALHCLRAIVDERFDDLREIVSTIKSYICNSLPPRDVRTFGDEFLDFVDRECETTKVRDYPNMNHKVLLEVLMDRQMDELQLSYDLVLLKSLDPSDACRFLKLKKLDLSYLQRSLVTSLPITRIKDFCLKDLRHFVSRADCTDSELKIIADNCPELESLEFQLRPQITDEGLLNLRQCKKLRNLDITGCQSVNWNGVLRLIKTHDRIETLSYPIFSAPDFRISEYAKYPTLRSVKRLEITENFEFHTDHLEFLVTVFPSLNHLEIGGYFAGELSPLMRLSKLEKLELVYEKWNANHRVQYCVLHGFLKSVSANLSHLYLFRVDEISCNQVQKEFNLLFHNCENLVNLHFHWHLNEEALTQLIVPPSEKLKSLCCGSCDVIGTVDSFLQMRFERMPALVFLGLRGCKMRMKDLKSIINEHEKFPELEKINLDRITNDEVKEIEQITREKNLNLSIFRRYSWVFCGLNS